jgi:antibiotic biosynthesis monooxygenase (ABM) superfamily enzyme
MPIHVAITRRVRPGRETEFQQGLHDFIQRSFNESGVLGASILTPPPGSGSREYGILRTFANEQERDAFYDSPLFKEWREWAKTMTEGEPEYRQLHGLEAWFRSPGAHPPRWKMALMTLLGVYPTSLLLTLTLGKVVHTWPVATRSLAIAVAMVALLTWVVMPFLTRMFRGWLKGREVSQRTD